MKILFLFLALQLPMISSAGSYQGKVSNVFSYSGKVFIRVSSGNFDNSTTCTGATQSLMFWLDPTDEFDKAQLAIALSAKMADRLVWAKGNNSCVSGPLGSSERLVAMDLRG